MHATWFDRRLCVYETNGLLRASFDPSVGGHKLLHELLCDVVTARAWLAKHYPSCTRLLVIE